MGKLCDVEKDSATMTINNKETKMNEICTNMQKPKPYFKHSEVLFDNSLQEGSRVRKCCGTIVDKLNSKPAVFLSLLFLVVSFAILASSLITMLPYSAEKKALLASYRESSSLHQTCRSSYDELKGKFNNVLKDLAESKQQNIELKNDIVSKNKEIEFLRQTLFDQSSELANEKRRVSELTASIQLKNYEISNFHGWQSQQGESSGTWSFLNSLFSGSSVAAPSYHLIISTLCLTVLLLKF